MKLIFLGCGAAFVTSPNNFHSNMLIVTDSGKRFMIDCGADARHSTQAVGLAYRDIDGIYISHYHSDHAGGLEWVAFSTKFDPEAGKPDLYVQHELLDTLWNNVLSGGLKSIEGDKSADLNTYFNVHPVDGDNTFQWEDIQFECIRTIHVYNGPNLVPSYGLFFTLNGTKIFITTDMQFNPDLYEKWYREADVIFHDCETSPTPSGVHPHYTQLTTLDPAIKSKMWLYHYNETALPDAKKDGFIGFVTCQQTFNFD